MRTNYKDYIPSTSQKQYQMTDNPNGTVSLTDVTEYTQEGDKFSAGILNELSQNANWPLTHSKSGTTHALTGLSGVSGTVSCVFKATAAYAAGDSIRVDGTSYTIQLSNGEAAEDNLFVSGASVPVVIDTAGKKVNFKAAGGAKFPAGTWVLLKTFYRSVTGPVFEVPITGEYKVTAVAKGGTGGTGSWQGGGTGGGSGAWACSIIHLTKGETVPCTVKAALVSFGSYLSVTRGTDGSSSAVGIGGTASGGTLYNKNGLNGAAGLDHIHGFYGGDGAMVAEPELSPYLTDNYGAGGSYAAQDAHDPEPNGILVPLGCGGGGSGYRESPEETGTPSDGGNGALFIELYTG